MHIIYDSLTGNTRRFARKVADLTGLEIEPIAAAHPEEPYLLLTYTFGTGAVPDTTAKFLREYGQLMQGVVSSGSFHWGENFGRAGDLISEYYGVPFVARVNKSGNLSDAEAVALWLQARQSQAAD